MADCNRCGECENLKREQAYTDFWGETKYPCKKNHSDTKFDSPACYDFKKIDKNSGSYTPTGCFITTVVCEVLGYEDNCELLCLLRNFRDNTLKLNPTYIPILLEYDQVGPTISECIRNKQDNFSFALRLMDEFLLPCVSLIKKGQVEDAVKVYTNMVQKLIEIFDLPPVMINVDAPYDEETLGKGRIRDFNFKKVNALNN